MSRHKKRQMRREVVVYSMHMVVKRSARDMDMKVNNVGSFCLNNKNQA